MGVTILNEHLFNKSPQIIMSIDTFPHKLSDSLSLQLLTVGKEDVHMTKKEFKEKHPEQWKQMLDEAWCHLLGFFFEHKEEFGAECEELFTWIKQESAKEVTVEEQYKLLEDASAKLMEMNGPLVNPIKEAMADVTMNDLPWKWQTQRKKMRIEDDAAVEEDKVAVVEDKVAVVEDKVAVVEDEAAVVEDKAAVVEDKAAVEEDKAVVEDKAVEEDKAEEKKGPQMQVE